MKRLGALLFMAAFAAPAAAQAPSSPPPELRAGTLADDMSVDGRLDEPAWQQAEAIDAFTQTEPADGEPPSARTVVRVLAGRKALVIGIVCDDDPNGIVSFSKQRDAALRNEDHVRVVLGPFMDGRSGYVFAVNPSGARYDGLIEPGGEHENANWDGIWEAGTARSTSGWSLEIRIPIDTLSFKPGLTAWHFNVQRRIQRLQEHDRWAAAMRQYQVTQTSRAGLLTSLPITRTGNRVVFRPPRALHVNQRLEHRQHLLTGACRLADDPVVVLAHVATR